jgi:hypothetical protein
MEVLTSLREKSARPQTLIKPRKNMEYQFDLQEKRITFDVLESEPEILENLSFVHLVKMKFNGEEISISKENHGTDPVIRVTIEFSDWAVTDSAKVHCNQSLNQVGNVKADYKGALQYADPAHRFAHAMIDLAKN